MKTIFCGALFIALVTSAFADPQLTSWLTTYSGQYARAYTNTTKRSNGSSVTTWAKQGVPAYADVPFVGSSTSWVYIRSSDLPSYIIGPWLNPQGAVGQFYPTNQHVLNRFPRSPAVQSGTKDTTGTGYSGLFVNGVAIFNFTDGKAWDGTDVVSGPHTQSTYYWHRNAPVGEDYNFDYPLGHQNPSGVYHTHQQPIALRYQLNDHVDYNSSTKNYSEGTNAVTAHSPIIGWSYDGYPIYGPYGYSISNNASSGIRRMVSGYVLRDGKNGTDNLTNNLSVIPAWYARFRQNHFGGTYSTTAGTSRPATTGTNLLGTYAEDYSYYGDLTNSATGQKYVMGTNTFDLDEHNGHWCVTPEFTNGTYAYFLDIDTNGNSTYPYVFAYEYYGNSTGGSVSSISETVTTNFYGGPDATLAMNTPVANTNLLVTLVWSSTEGGTYQVESSTNQTTWTVQKTNIAATIGVSTTTNYTSTFSNGIAYVRITRTGLADYDDAGGSSGVTNQTAIKAFVLVNTGPTVANAIPNQTNTYGNSFSYTFPTNTFTDADTNQTLTYTASGAILTNAAISFNSSTRTFSATTIDATNGGTVVGSYTVQVVATDNGSPAKSATNNFTLSIGKAAASVKVDSFTRSYGSTNPTLTGTLSNFLSADSITATYSCSAVTNSEGGNSTYPITVAFNDPGTRLGNYLITTNNGTLTVTSAVLTVTASNVSRSYGATNPTFGVSYSGFMNSETLANSGVINSPVLTTSATTNSSAGSYVITNSQGSMSAANYTFNLVNGTLTVTQAVLTVTATNTTRAYGATNPTFTASYSGFVNGQTLANSGVTGSPTLTTSATTNSSPGSYVLTNSLGSLAAANYSFALANGTVTVSKTPLTVTANAFSRGYGATNPTFTVSYTGFMNGETASSGTISGSPSLTTSATTNSTVGNYAITNSIGTLSSAYYTLTNFNNGTLTVTQAVLTVTANNTNRAYGATNPVFTASYSGFTNGQTLASSGVTGSPTLTTSATTNSAVGSYVITNSISTLASVNYSFALANGTVTVTQAPLIVGANSTNRIYGATNPVFTGTITGLANNDNITLNGGTTSATTNSVPGNYSITPAFSDPGSKIGNYTITTNTGTLTISKASLLVTANDASRAYGSTNPIFTASYSGFVNGETFSSGTISGLPSLTSAGTNASVGSYTITNSLGTLASSYYNFTLTNGTLTVTQTVLSVTPANVSRAYGQTNPILTGTVSGLANSDNITANYATIAMATSPIGTYPITATLNDPNSRLANYNVTTNTGTLTVTNAVGASNYSTTLALSNSLVKLAAVGTTNLTFTDTNSGLSIVVAVTMSPYSASNATPSFTFLDTFGPGGTAVHLGEESGLSGGDGNWVDFYEGETFSASLVSVSSGILTNTVRFGITGIGLRPGGGTASWTSSAGTNSFSISSETLFGLDTNTAALSGTNYSGLLLDNGSYQLSDLINSDYLGIVFTATFYEGSGTPVITTDITNTSVCSGSLAMFSAAAFGEPTPSIQWQVQTNGGSSFANIAGATNTTYSFTAAVSDNGSQYRAVFTNSSGSATTTVATVTVGAPLSATITLPSASVTANTTNTASATAGAATYFWTISNGSIVGATNTQSISYVANGFGTVTLSLTVANASGCTVSTTTNVPIMVSLPGVYVSYFRSNLTEKFDASGNGSLFDASLKGPVGAAFDRAGNLFVANYNTGTITEFATNGVRSTFATGLLNPVALAFDASGNLFASQLGNNTIAKITTNGLVSAFSTNTSSPLGLAFDASGNLYVANYGISNVMKFDSTGTGSIFATNINGAAGMAFDASGNLYVANLNDSTIWKLDASGTPSIFASTNLNGPFGIAFDNSGNLYAANALGSNVVKFTSSGSSSAINASGLNNPYWPAVWPLPSQLIPNSVILPLISLTSPTNGQSFNAGETHTISATATSSNSTITKVEFFEDGVKFGESTAAPYTAMWTNLYAGVFTLTARATDVLGSTNSASVSVTSEVYMREFQMSGSTVQFKLYGGKDEDYIIYYSGDLINWSFFPGVHSVTNGALTIILPDQPGTNRFYRIVAD